MIKNLIVALKKEEAGQALIELAISLPLLSLILLGAVEFTRLSIAAIEVTNSARSAVQYGAMNGGNYLSSGTNGLDSGGMLHAAQADAGDMGSSVTFASGYPSKTCTCTGGGTTTCGSPPVGCSPPSSVVMVTISVRTQATFNPFIFAPGSSHSGFTLHGWAQQVVLPR